MHPSGSSVVPAWPAGTPPEWTIAGLSRPLRRTILEWEGAVGRASALPTRSRLRPVSARLCSARRPLSGGRTRRSHGVTQQMHPSGFHRGMVGDVLGWVSITAPAEVAQDPEPHPTPPLGRVPPSVDAPSPRRVRRQESVVAFGLWAASLLPSQSWTSDVLIAHVQKDLRAQVDAVVTDVQAGAGG